MKYLIYILDNTERENDYSAVVSYHITEARAGQNVDKFKTQIDFPLNMINMINMIRLHLIFLLIQRCFRSSEVAFFVQLGSLKMGPKYCALWFKKSVETRKLCLDKLNLKLSLYFLQYLGLWCAFFTLD